MIRDIPEIRALESARSLIRIPPETDVPLTSRVRRLIDTSAFRRLSGISQLGLVSLVYPAAHHSRFEHSLGVYRTGLRYLQQLAHHNQFCSAVHARDAERFIVATLLHDIGHWPFCHPLEDLGVASIPRHELLAAQFIADDEIANLLRTDWGLTAEEVLDLLSGKAAGPAASILSSMLSGPIDVDKMDYLARDSLHAGVPYGRNYDQARLIGSLCVDRDGTALGITEKGRTAAEMMVFARYVMFSEVYWHHTVRAATAMLQRAFLLLVPQVDLSTLYRLSEAEMVMHLQQTALDGPAEELISGLFGAQRKLYKRLAQFSYFEQADMYRQLAGRPYTWLVQCSEQLCGVLSRARQTPLPSTALLLDAPPAKREIEIDIDVAYTKEGCFRTLGQVSPVVKTLAEQQFDDYVKRVRVFVAPEFAEELKQQDVLAALREVL